MGKRYAVLGAGQGEATAYRLSLYPDTDQVLLIDNNADRCFRAAERIYAIVGPGKVTPVVSDAQNVGRTASLLSGVDAVVGAISFKLNEYLTDLAIELKSHYVDMGGNTGVVQAQHKRDKKAKENGVSIVPDTGMGPGFNLSLAHAVAKRLGEPRAITIYCGGLPIKPEGELNYALFFSLEGLVNEYMGQAATLRGRKLRHRPTIADIEEKFLPMVGRLEAANTSGGVSTAPWTYPELFPTLEQFSYKTLRYPGHWKAIAKWKRGGWDRLYKELGERLGHTISGVHDLGIILVEGESVSGKKVTARVIDRFDDKVTGFSAMQRLTGYHSAVIAYLASHGELPAGVIPVETIDGERVVEEMAKCGIVTGIFE